MPTSETRETKVPIALTGSRLVEMELSVQILIRLEVYTHIIK